VITLATLAGGHTTNVTCRNFLRRAKANEANLARIADNTASQRHLTENMKHAHAHAEAVPAYAEAIPAHAEAIPAHAEAIPAHADPVPTQQVIDKSSRIIV
jgi:hypothetical protein